MRSVLLLILTALAAMAAVPAHASALSLIDRHLRGHFPDVATVGADELQRQLSSESHPIILDVREADEFAVSHLPGAVRIDPDASLDAVFRVIGPELQGRTVILYCSVGLRSTQLAHRVGAGLKRRGAGQIANLREGIFGWHNAKRALTQGGRPTTHVHPYNAQWGQLVTRQDLATYEPEPREKAVKKAPVLNETQVRLGVFLGVFALLGLAESVRPYRTLLLPRKTRWISHFSMLGLATLVVRIAAFLFPLIGAAAAATYADRQGWGLFNWLFLPAWIEILLAMVMLDLAIWAQHVATHRVPVFWRVHRVHHADRDLDASSALRFHPIEMLLSALYKLVVILILGPAMIAVIAFEIILNASAMFNHANWALPERCDHVLRHLIVTPDMHRTHHSVVRNEHDRNFGFCLSCWDRMFGTYKAAPDAGHHGMKIGLADWQDDDRPARLGWLLALPFCRPTQ